MKMSGHRMREVFERFNIVSEVDLEEPFGASKILDTFWTKWAKSWR